MKKWIILIVVLLVAIICLANWIIDYAVYSSSMQTYGLVKFCIPLMVVCTGIIVFFIEKNGIQTREKIEEEMEALHKSLEEQKNKEEKSREELFQFKQPHDGDNQQTNP